MRSWCDPGESRTRASVTLGWVRFETGTVAGPDGVEIAFTVEGDGPAVLLIHGFPDDRTLWAHQQASLVDRGHAVVAVDQRGFGHSGKPADWKAYRAFRAAADMIAVVDQLGLDRVDVVGHDWGAATAAFLSMFHPSRVDRLVLISAGHPGVFRTLGTEQLERAWYMHFFVDVEVAAEWLRANDWANLRTWGRHPNVDDVIERLAEPAALLAALRWYRANSHPRTFLAPEKELPRIPHPTLGIWGADDPHLVEEFMTRTAQMVDGAWRYERIDDAGHWIQIDQPDQLSALLIDYLSR